MMNLKLKLNKHILISTILFMPLLGYSQTCLGEEDEMYLIIEDYAKHYTPSYIFYGDTLVVARLPVLPKKIDMFLGDIKKKQIANVSPSICLILLKLYAEHRSTVGGGQAYDFCYAQGTSIIKVLKIMLRSEKIIKRNAPCIDVTSYSVIEFVALNLKSLPSIVIDEYDMIIANHNQGSGAE